MASEHSKGPFSICLGSGGCVCTVVRNAEGKFIADFCPDYFLKEEGVDTVDVLEQVANMNLFTASPDMHDALTDIIREAYTEVPTIGWTELMQQALEKGRAALRKARGETDGG